MEKRTNTLIKRVEESIELSLKNKTFLNVNPLELFGFTSHKNKIFLSTLANYEDVNYLELGIFRGATIVPVGLSKCKNCVGIDNFSYNPYRNPAWKTEGYVEVENSVHDNLERYKLLNKVKIVKNDIFDNLFEFENVSTDNNLVYVDIEPITPILISTKEDEEEPEYKKQLTKLNYSSLFKRIIKSCSQDFILVVANANKDEKSKIIQESLKSNSDIIIKNTNILKNTNGMRQDNGWYNGLNVFVISKKEKKAGN